MARGVPSLTTVLYLSNTKRSCLLEIHELPKGHKRTHSLTLFLFHSSFLSFLSFLSFFPFLLTEYWMSPPPSLSELSTSALLTGMRKGLLSLLLSVLCLFTGQFWCCSQFCCSISSRCIGFASTLFPQSSGRINPKTWRCPGMVEGHFEPKSEYIRSWRSEGHVPLHVTPSFPQRAKHISTFNWDAQRSSFAASFCPVFIHRTVLMLQPILLQHFQQVHWLCQHLIPPL